MCKNPDHPFQPSTGNSITLSRASDHQDQVANLTMDNVITVLQDNCVPVEWVDHSYAYGLHYLAEHLAAGDQHSVMLEEINNEHITCLGLHGCPPTIPMWDGWWTPLSEDCTQIQLLMSQKEMSDFFCMKDSFNWVPVGEDTFPLFIHQSMGSIHAPVTTPLLLMEGRPPSISPQAIAIEFSFVLTMEDQVMADVMDRQPTKPRGSTSSSKPLIESHGPTGTTLRDGHK
jgi:hypothetical protein